MDQTFSERVLEIFADAIEQRAECRSKFLDAVCMGPDAARIRREVESLLAAHVAAGDYLADPSASSEAAEVFLTEEMPGTVISQYILRERLGEGGFGVVYLAEQQEPIRRDVALKVMKAGMDTRQVVARFQYERQALAKMNHPGIAKVLDAGATAAGRPYFVMELVPGEPVTEFCDRHELSITARLRLFIDICAAVQHAHQKGIIHRDLKPSNILVLMIDDQPRVKIIDFGIAKALSGVSDDVDEPRPASTLTADGQFLGTPDYMSPEQAGGAGLGEVDIDTRTDVYSLGVLLYQLLTGVLPFDPTTLRAGDLFEIRRRIREIDPAKPSTKIRQMCEENSAVAAKLRLAEGRSLIRRLRGDLDWITMKALAKERSRRYASASEFAEDVQRHLDGVAVSARPPSVRYRAAKFIRRHRHAVAAASAVLAALIAGITATSFALVEAQHQRDAARNLAYRSTIAAASAALSAGDYLAAGSQLDQSPSERRGWEWRHLQTRLDSTMRVVDAPAIPSPKFTLSPDGRRIILVTTDFLHIHDLESGRLLRSVEVEHASVSLPVISPRGDLILIIEQHDPWGVDDSTLVMRDLNSGRELWRLERAIGGPRMFSASGTTVSVGLGDGDKGFAAWVDARTGAVLDQARIGGPPKLVAMGADGAITYVTANAEKIGIAGIVHRNGGATEQRRGHVFSRPIMAPDRPVVVWSNWTDDRVMWTDVLADTGRYIQGRPGVSRIPLAWSDDGRWIAFAEGRHVLVWDVEAWELAAILPGHVAEVTSGCFSPDGDLLLTGDAAGAIRLWNIPPATSPWFMERWETWPRWHAAISPDGRTIATVGWSFVRLWDVPAGVVRRIHNVRSSDIRYVAFSPDGDRLALAARERGLMILDAHRGATLMTTSLRGPGTPAWTPDGTAVLWLDDRGNAQWIDLPSGQPLHEFVFSSPLRLIHVAGNRLMAVAWPKEGTTATLLVWNIDSKQLIRRVELSAAEPRCMAASVDGRLVAIADASNQVELWDITRWKRVWNTMVDAASIEALAFSNDGSRLAVGHVGGIKLLAAATGERQVSLPHEVGDVAGLAFTTDDHSLVACGVRHPMVIYDALPLSPAIHRTRSRMKQGRDVAEPLFRTLLLSERVVEELRANTTFLAWQREAAITYAQARGDHLAGLVSDAYYRMNREEYEPALLTYRTARAASGQPEERWDASIAYALYHMGRYEEAYESIQRYIRATDRGFPLKAADWVLLALTADRRGETETARTAWRKAQEFSEPNDELSRRVWREAVARFGGESSRR